MVTFEDGSEVRFSLKESDYPGPEAVIFYGGSVFGGSGSTNWGEEANWFGRVVAFASILAVLSAIESDESCPSGCPHCVGARIGANLVGVAEDHGEPAHILLARRTICSHQTSKDLEAHMNCWAQLTGLFCEAARRHGPRTRRVSATVYR